MSINSKWIAPLAIAALLSLTSAAQAATPVFTPHSGWFWGNPKPQGNTLAAVAFEGARGYAVGYFGAVLRSDDAGASWSGMRAGTTNPLGLVQTLGPNTVFVGGECTLRRSDDAGATFKQLPFTASEERCPSYVAAISFPTSAQGFVLLANGTVLFTADGGQTFSSRTSVPGATATGQTGTATDIDFTSPGVGTAVASGRIYRTTNGGGSWTAVSPAGGRVAKVQFTDVANAVAVGGGGTFLASQDGGASFDSRPLTGAGAGKEFAGVTCANPQSCLLTLSDTQVVRTDDGGATSTLVKAADAAVFGVDFATAGRVVGVGSVGFTVLSNDSGASFAPVGSRFGESFVAIRSATGDRAYALGNANGEVARTLDGGRSWSPFRVPTGGQVQDVSFPVTAAGYALDGSGGLFRTANAGDSWRILDPGVTGDPTAVVASSPTRLAVIGPKGVRFSKTSGDSFSSSRSRAVRRAALTDADRAGSSIFAWGPRTLARSGDGGRTWAKVRTPRGGSITSVDFVSRRRGFLVKRDGRAYVTKNGGRRWRRLTAVGRDITRISFGDARHGFALDGEDLLRTENGGLAWAPQEVITDSLTAVAATRSHTGFLAGGDALFGTASGGRLGKNSRLTLRTSKRRLRRAGTVRLAGRLAPASPGSRVTVVMRRGSAYTRKSAVVASNGSFSASFRVRGTSTFLAQWRGDDQLDGDGTSEVRVTVKRRR